MSVITCVGRSLLKCTAKVDKKSVYNGFNLFPTHKRWQTFGIQIRSIGHSETHLRPAQLWKPFAFSTAFTCLSFGCATIYEYENARRNASRNWPFQSQRPKSSSPQYEWWNNLRDVEKVFYGILFANACVYLAWKVPAFRKTLEMYFTDHTLKTPLYLPMLLNTFSHYSVIHLGINMYVLSSFSTGLSRTLTGEEFLAFYLSSAVFSSFTSLCFKVLRGSRNPSVGASGAIFAVFALFSATYPNATLQIVLIPNFTFTAEKGLIGAMCLDSLGMLFNWKIFDHASHFGGALFGLWYAKWGRNFLRSNRIKLAQKWHDLRSKK